ncbi:MAG: thioredoxin [Chitinispirillaceae bacterium]|nr:thioredoxin [Chitinispirillaceae bacterium]
MKKFLAILLIIISTVNAQEALIRDSSQYIADKIIQSEIPVLVDFWAVWCLPCRILNPIIKELEEKYKDQVLFIKVNVDRNRALSSYFGVSSIPTVFLIDQKTVVALIPGVHPKETYVEAIEKVLKNKKSTPATTDSSKKETDTLLEKKK